MSCKPPSPRSCEPRPEGRLDTLAKIVDHYIAEVRPRACADLEFYSGQLSLGHALEVVASWRRGDARVEPHQRRLSRQAKTAAAKAIRKLDLQEAMTFEAVFQAVQDAIGDIRGVGDLAVYDVALRLSAVLGQPAGRVYLQSGARKGARALGITTRERSLPRDAFPAELRRLHAWEIENLLCIYKDELVRLTRRRSAA